MGANQLLQHKYKMAIQMDIKYSVRAYVVIELNVVLLVKFIY